MPAAGQEALTHPTCAPPRFLKIVIGIAQGCLVTPNAEVSGLRGFSRRSARLPGWGSDGHPRSTPTTTVYGSSFFSRNIRLAFRAMQKASVRLQCGLLFLVHAGCTKIVHWLAVFMSWLQRVGEGSNWELKKRVALNLTLPVFNLSYLLFKFAHPLGERRLLLLARQLRSDGIRELYLNGGNCGKEFAVIGEPVSSFDKLDSGLGALDSGGDFGVHLKTPNVGGQRQP